MVSELAGSFSSNFKKIGCFESTPAYKASSIFHSRNSNSTGIQAVSTAILQGELQFCPSSRLFHSISVFCVVFQGISGIFQGKEGEAFPGSLQCISIGRIPILRRQGRPGQVPRAVSRVPAHTSSAAETAF